MTLDDLSQEHMLLHTRNARLELENQRLQQALLHAEALLTEWMRQAADLAKCIIAADANLLDAQKWHFFLAAQDETRPENKAVLAAADRLGSHASLSEVMAIAMKGHQL